MVIDPMNKRHSELMLAEIRKVTQAPIRYSSLQYNAVRRTAYKPALTCTVCTVRMYKTGFIIGTSSTHTTTGTTPREDRCSRWVMMMIMMMMVTMIIMMMMMVLKDEGAEIVSHIDAYNYIKANPSQDLVLPDTKWSGER